MDKPPETSPERTPEPGSSEALAALVSAAREGSQAAFAQLVKHYETRVFNFLLQWVGNRHDAEDLAQETFVQAYAGLPRYDARWSFSTWLYTIARRRAIGHWRATKSWESLPEEAGWESLEADPAANAAETDDRRRIWHLARRLPETQFTVLWLHYAEDFPVEQIARILGTNRIHVRVTLFRARRALARHLTESVPDAGKQTATPFQPSQTP
jgi:RNA polymerase sigma-70 factor (ECF subfamily)